LLGELRFPVDAALGGLYFVSLETEGGAAEPNIYLFGTSEETPYAPALRNVDARLSVEAMTDWSAGESFEGLAFLERTFEVRNDGAAPALFVHPVETTNAYWMEADRAYLTIMPGTSARVTTRCTVKRGGGFAIPDQPAPGADVPPPNVTFEFLHSR
jgi:beta-mannosidase